MAAALLPDHFGTRPRAFFGCERLPVRLFAGRLAASALMVT